MAKKIESKLDDFGFDTGLDDFDFDFETKAVKNDRKPSTKVAIGVAKGVAKSFTDERFIQGAVKNIFPKGYSAGLDTLIDAKNGIKDLYNTAFQEIKPALNDLKRVTNSAIPMGSKYIPGGLYKKLERWSENYEKESSGYSYQNQDDYEMQQSLAEIAKLQAEDQDKREQRQDVKDQLREGLDFARHKESISQLNQMRMNLSQLVTYQNKITSVYQKKSLELQYRQFFVARDALIEQKRFSAEMKTYLESINKNTALPDYVKLKNKEYLGQAMRNRFLNSALTGLIGDRSQFVKNTFQSLGTNFKNSLGQTFSGIRSGLSNIEMGIEEAKRFKESGMADQIDLHGLAGEQVGAFIFQNMLLGNRIGRGLRRQANKIPGIQKGSNQLEYFLNNIPQMSEKFAKSSWGSFGPLSFLVNPLKDTILQQRAGRHVDVDNIRNLQEPGIYTRQTNKTINEVIPGLLTRIHHELAMIRTGDTNIEPISYDYTTNKFDTSSKVKSNIIRSVINPAQKESVGRDIESLIDKIDPQKKLSPEARRALGIQLLQDNVNNKEGTVGRLTSARTFKGDASKYSKEYVRLFRDYFGQDKDFSRRNEFSQAYNSLGRFINVDKENLQHIVNSGLGQTLADAGLLSLGGPDTRDPAGYLDFNKYASYYYNDQYKPGKETGVGPVAGRMRSVGSILDRESMTPTTVNRTFNRNINFNENSLSPVISAIQAINPIELLTIANTTLNSIDTKLSTGIVSVNGGTINPSQLAQTVKEAQDNAKSKSSLIGGIYGHAKNLVKSSFGLLTATGKLTDKTIGVAAREIYRTGKIGLKGGFYAFKLGVLNPLAGEKNLYIHGKAEPVISELRMKAGEYRDAVTNKVIRNLKDIKGPVIDSNGIFVIQKEDLDHLYTKTKLGLSKPFKIVSTLARHAGGIGNAIGSSIFRSVKTGLSNVKNFGKWFFSSKNKDDNEGEDSSGKSPFSKLLGATSYLGSKGLGFAGKAGNFLASGIGEGLFGFTKIFSAALEPIFRGRRIVSRLTEIRDLLDDRLPGKKIRKGSYEDQQKQKKEDEKEDRENSLLDKVKGDSWNSSIYGMGAGALSKLFNRKKKKEDEDGEDSDGGFLSEAAGTAAGGWLGGKVGKIGKGILKYGKKGLRKLPGIAGLALAGKGIYDVASGKENLDIGNALTIGGGLAMSGLGRTAIMTGGRLAIAGAGALISAIGLPVVLGATAIGAAGYFGYKYFTRKKPETLSTIRYIQYGWKPGDDDKFRKILEFEGLLSDAVVYRGAENADIDAQKISPKAKDIAEIFGISLQSQEDVTRWSAWFTRRFKPIFLKHLIELKKIKSEVKLADVDKDLEIGEKIKYLDATAFPNGPYDSMITPFIGEKGLETTGSDVTEAVKNARDILMKEAKDSGVDVSKISSAGSATAVAVATKAAIDSSKDTESKEDEKPGLLGKIGNFLKSTSIFNPLLPVVLLAKGAQSAYQSFFGPIDDETKYLLHLRMMQYGAKYRNVSAYRSLLKLDSIAVKYVKDLDRSPSLVINNEKEIDEIFKTFGISPKDEIRVASFFDWLQNRYSKVLFMYMQLLKSLNKSTNVINIDQNLTAKEKYQFLESMNDTVDYTSNSSPFVSKSALFKDSAFISSYIEKAKDALKQNITDEDRKAASNPRLGNNKTNSSIVKNNTGTLGATNAKAASNTLMGSNGSAASSVANGTGALDKLNNTIQATTMPWAGGTRLLKGDGGANRKMVIDTARSMGIQDPRELAMFLAQLDHESAGFTTLEENVNYSASRLRQVFPKYFKTDAEAQAAANGGPQAIASIIYGNRMGNNGSGDGYTYRGRGFIQLTGKDNYKAASRDLGIDLVNNPDLASTPDIAAKIAVWYWQKRKGLALAGQTGDVRTATKLINGGFNGLADRTQLYGKYLSMVQNGELENLNPKIVDNSMGAQLGGEPGTISTSPDLRGTVVTPGSSSGSASVTNSGSLSGYSSGSSSSSSGGFNANSGPISLGSSYGGSIDSAKVQTPGSAKEFIATLNPKFIELGQKSIRLQNGNVDIKGMNKEFMTIFYAMIGEYVSTGGSAVQVNSAYRSPEKQKELYDAWIARGKTGGMVAQPGKSRHNSGVAIDINSASANDLSAHGLLNKYLFIRPVRGEAWHLENKLFSSKPLAEYSKDFSRESQTQANQAVNAVGSSASTLSVGGGNNGSNNSPTASSGNSSSMMMGGYSPAMTTTADQIAEQQSTNASSIIGGAALVDSMNSNVAVNKEILGVNNKQLDVLLQIANLLVQNGNGKTVSDSIKPSNKSTDISKTPVNLNKRYAA